MFKNREEKNVVVANDIIQKGKFSLSAKELKIIFYIIAQIKRDDEDLREYEFNLIDFCHTCGVERGGMQRKELKDALLRLEQPWTIQNGNRIISLAWTRGFEIDPDTNKLIVTLDHRLKPYLIQLKDHFTKWELEYTLHFKSKYTIRLYILIKSIHFNDSQEYQKEYSVTELKSLLDSDYVEYRDFHSKVLKVAINEINKYSDKLVSYEQIKEGRSVSSIILNIQTKKQEEQKKVFNAPEKKKELKQSKTQAVVQPVPDKEQAELSNVFKSVFGREPDDAFKKIASRSMKERALSIEHIQQLIEFAGRMKPNVPEAYIITMLRGGHFSSAKKVSNEETEKRLKDLYNQKYDMEAFLSVAISHVEITGNYDKINEYEKIIEDIKKEIDEIESQEKKDKPLEQWEIDWLEKLKKLREE